MFKSNLIIAWRKLIKNKVISVISIFGLAAGMAVATLNGLWLWDELSFNSYHQHYDHIAQVMNHETYQGTQYTNFSLPYPLATELKTKYKSLFKHIILASWIEDDVLSSDGKNVSAKGQFMEDGMAEMLSLKMIHGSWSGLKETNTIFLSSSTAKALFGDKDPINRLMKINNKNGVKVTGVYQDLPRNTQFQEINFISTWDLFVINNDWIKKKAATDWANHFLRIYTEVQPNLNINQVSAAISNAELPNLGQFKELAKLKPEIFLQPMSRWHLYSQFKRGLPDYQALHLVWLVALIGIIVVLLACINFMNLSTAQSERRAKEVGIRKAIGSMRSQLVGQFFCESLLVSCFSFLLALFFVSLSLPWFNHLSSKEISMPWTNLWFWAVAILFILTTGLLAGSYPALFLSSFRPVKVLKGSFRLGQFSSLPRKILVVLQFSVSVILMIGTIIIYRQIQYAKNRPIGYSTNGLIMMAMKSEDYYGKYALMQTALKQTGVVADMAESMGKVTEVVSGNDGFEWKGKDPSHNKSFGTLAVTQEFGKTVGWEFLDGRDFSRQFITDSEGVVINESAVQYMGMQHPVGERISWKFADHPINYYTILGVIKDMLMESPYEPITPTIFFLKAPNGSVNWIDIKINPGVSTSEALPKIEAVFKKLIPSAPFEYQFADQEYALKFNAEERIGKLAAFFAILAILISCLGLFGLALFMAEQRTKEIGVRKILGASVYNLWQLLSRDFLALVLISLLIAAPTAYFFMYRWLQSYQYRSDLPWWIFLVAGSFALLIALLTVSFQAVKAALTNPVKSLRTE
jgi:putative ABC transport system permease protein